MDKIVHLTFSGVLAGQTYCGAPRNETDEYHHANDQALKEDSYRSTVCGVCLRIYDESFDD